MRCLLTHSYTHTQQNTQAASSSKSKDADTQAGFEVVAKEEVSYEVSRTFAAMLQLINNR